MSISTASESNLGLKAISSGRSAVVTFVAKIVASVGVLIASCSSRQLPLRTSWAASVL